jgi:hypothetical protein
MGRTSAGKESWRILQEDNDGAQGMQTHWNSCAQWKKEHKIECLDHPPHSPDMNIIETIWRKIKVRVRARKCKTNEELKPALLEEWDRITQKKSMT